MNGNEDNIFLSRFLEALPINTFEVDPTGEYKALKDTNDDLLVEVDQRTGNFWSDINDQLSETLWNRYRHSQKESRAIEEEFSFYKAEGEIVWLKVTIVAGHEISYLSYENITEKKKDLAKIMRDERISTIGILAGGLAHQYNNLHHAVMAHCFRSKARRYF